MPNVSTTISPPSWKDRCNAQADRCLEMARRLIDADKPTPAKRWFEAADAARRAADAEAAVYFRTPAPSAPPVVGDPIAPQPWSPFTPPWSPPYGPTICQSSPTPSDYKYQVFN